MADWAVQVAGLVGDQAGEWDRAGRIPREVLDELGRSGLLCAQVPAGHGGAGLVSLENGSLTAHVGSLCSSLRSVMTSQGMAAWAIQRLGTDRQCSDWLPLLVDGTLAAVGFSEPQAGSDLSAINTSVRTDGDDVVLDGHKVWVTAAAYADLIVIFGRYGSGGAAVVVPTDAPGLRIERVEDPLGCRAAGHAGVRLDGVRVPKANVLGAAGSSLPLLVTSALAYGRMSVAWGCVGILSACLMAAAQHAASREQFGKPLGQHQLVAGHLADLYVAERTARLVCEHASRAWDAGSPDVVSATVLAKQVGATQAVAGAARAVQVLASAGARDGHVVARAYRDAKLMELIEGSTELCRLLLAQHALDTTRGLRENW